MPSNKLNKQHYLCLLFSLDIAISDDLYDTVSLQSTLVHCNWFMDNKKSCTDTWNLYVPYQVFKFEWHPYS